MLTPGFDFAAVAAAEPAVADGTGGVPVVPAVDRDGPGDTSDGAAPLADPVSTSGVAATADPEMGRVAEVPTPMLPAGHRPPATPPPLPLEGSCVGVSVAFEA